MKTKRSSKHRDHSSSSNDSRDSSRADTKRTHRNNAKNRRREESSLNRTHHSHDHHPRSRSDRTTSKWDSPEERHRRRYPRRDHHRRSPPRRSRSRSHDRQRHHRRARSNSFDHSTAVWGKKPPQTSSESKPAATLTDKEKANFTLSGKLTEETNTYRGVVIKYSEPPEARKPKRRWRLYPFKGEKAMQTLYIHRESAYLIGRDRKIVDLPVDHPSCSKQHAALQYRLVQFTRGDGSVGKRVRPYIIDLESANGTYINNKKIDAKKYVELLERDVIKFGFSSREYVLLHENSKDEAQDDDVNDAVAQQQ